jgi:hypothetical protein
MAEYYVPVHPGNCIRTFYTATKIIKSDTLYMVLIYILYIVMYCTNIMHLVSGTSFSDIILPACLSHN